MTYTLPNKVVIACQFDIYELDLIEAALNSMLWRNQAEKDVIRKTLASVQLQKTYGERRNA